MEKGRGDLVELLFKDRHGFDGGRIMGLMEGRSIHDARRGRHKLGEEVRDFEALNCRPQ